MSDTPTPAQMRETADILQKSTSFPDDDFPLSLAAMLRQGAEALETLDELVGEIVSDASLTVIQELAEKWLVRRSGL